MLQSCLPLKQVIDLLLSRYCVEYELDPLTPRDWIVVEQVCDLLGPFEPLSRYLEGEKYVTVTEYLARFALIASRVFYTDVVNDSKLDPSVQAVKSWMRLDFGTRLWDSENDMTLAGLALHPT